MEPVHTIPAKSAVKFIRGLVCRFGVPNRIITDNGSQFISGAFKSYCGSLGAQICYASGLTHEATGRLSEPTPRCSRA